MSKLRNVINSYFTSFQTNKIRKSISITDEKGENSMHWSGSRCVFAFAPRFYNAYMKMSCRSLFPVISLPMQTVPYQYKRTEKKTTQPPTQSCSRYTFHCSCTHRCSRCRAQSHRFAVSACLYGLVFLNGISYAGWHMALRIYFSSPYETTYKCD